MKFILSFLIVTTVLSADTSFKLSVGNAALTQSTLCAPVNSLTPPSPVECQPAILKISTQPTIKCDLPAIKPTPSPIVSKCTPAPVICPTPTTPVIECPGAPGKGNPIPCDPSSATPEPASYALLGAGLMTAGFARKFRGNKK